jgi:xylan 1,4-beta-xylosidase
MMIRNPILRGFNPDPSIVRVGDDYYIATSTFEWFPGRPDPPFARPGELAAADRPLTAPASSTCAAIPTAAASGRRA